MRKLNQLALLAGLVLATPAMAQVVVTVDDDAGNDVAYVDGTGGNLSGAGALAAAVAAINADASGAPSYTVNIIDTDGAADMYVGDLFIGKANTTIQQVENGAGTSVGVTIQGDATVNGGGTGVVLAQAQAFTLSGISKAKPMTIDAGLNGGMNTGTELNGANGSTITWRYLIYSDTDIGGEAASGLVHNQFNYDAGNPQDVVDHFIGCVPNFVNGVQHVVDVEFTDCTLGNGANWLAVGFSGTETFNNCIIGPGAGFHWGEVPGLAAATFNDCTFQRNGRLMHHRNADAGPLALTFNGGDFSQNGGDIAINPGPAADGNIMNSPQTLICNDVDFTGMFDNGTVLAVRLSNGTATFNRCTGDARGGAGFTDAATNPFTGDVTVNMNQCIFGNGAGDFGGGDAAAPATAFSLTVNATNTIFYGTSGAGHLFTLGGSHTGASTINVLHSTLTLGTGNAYFFGDGARGDEVLIDGSVINPGRISGSHVLSSIGQGPGFDPHIPNVTYVNVADDGTGSPFVGNPLNASADVPAMTGDIVADPQLDAMGRPDTLSTNSPIGAAAVNSTMNVDVDGEPRPQPAGSVRDIGADETSLIPVELSGFSME